jgi:hypothetical protein
MSRDNQRDVILLIFCGCRHGRSSTALEKLYGAFVLLGFLE